MQERAATGDHHCRFVPNVPYAFISSALTFWFPVIIMLTVYYLVFKEAMKQKQNMERMTAIRTSAVSCSIGSTTVFTITEKAPTRAFSWLKVPTSGFTFKTLLLRHFLYCMLNQH